MEKKELLALVSLLEDDDKEIITHVEKKLYSLGTGVISILEKEWMKNSLDPKVRNKIEGIIHELQFVLLKERIVQWKEKGAEDLLEGMMLVANYQYPDISMKFLKRKIEQYYYQAWKEFKDEMGAIEQVKTLNHIMFNILRFRPNSKNLHTPSNSMINVVIESRRGSPLSLCVIYLLIAQRLKLPIYGVNLPDLFILTYKSKETQFYINVFNNGLIFSTDEINNYINQSKVSRNGIFPCTNKGIIVRVLKNLIIGFEKLHEYKKSDDIKQILHVLGD